MLIFDIVGLDILFYILVGELSISCVVYFKFSALCAEQVDISMAEKVLINYCVVDELLEIPGIGPSIVKRILEFRKTHGDFTSESFSAMVRVKNLSEVLSCLDEKQPLADTCYRAKIK